MSGKPSVYSARNASTKALCEIEYPNGVVVRVTSGIVTNEMKRNVQDGEAFIIVNRSLTSMNAPFSVRTPSPETSKEFLDNIALLVVTFLVSVNEDEELLMRERQPGYEDKIHSILHISVSTTAES